MAVGAKRRVTCPGSKLARPFKEMTEDRPATICCSTHIGSYKSPNLIVAKIPLKEAAVQEQYP
jgi:hypothetical protein